MKLFVYQMASSVIHSSRSGHGGWGKVCVFSSIYPLIGTPPPATQNVYLTRVLLVNVKAIWLGMLLNKTQPEGELTSGSKSQNIPYLHEDVMCLTQNFVCVSGWRHQQA